MISNWPTFQKSSFEFKFNADCCVHRIGCSGSTFINNIFLLQFKIRFFTDDLSLTSYCTFIFADDNTQKTICMIMKRDAGKILQKKIWQRCCCFCLLGFVVCMKRIIGLYKLSLSPPLILKWGFSTRNLPFKFRAWFTCDN